MKLEIKVKGEHVEVTCEDFGVFDAIVLGRRDEQFFDEVNKLIDKVNEDFDLYDGLNKNGGELYYDGETYTNTFDVESFVRLLYFLNNENGELVSMLTSMTNKEMM